MMPEGPLGFPRLTSVGPLVKERPVEQELEDAIGDEGSANKEYQRLIDLLEQSGRGDMAKRARSIQDDEIRHRKEFKQMLSKVRRE